MIKKWINKVYGDNLYKNSLFLIVNSFVMALFGFVFWTINARLFTAEQVGLASTLISVMGLLVNLSLLGFNVALLKYLPKSDYKDDKISSCFILSGIVSLIVSLIFVLGVKIFSPKLAFIQNKTYFVLFVLFILFGTLFMLIEAVFIASRKSKFVLLKNTIWSALKIIFPVFLVAWGAFGIFGSWMISMILALMISLFFIKINFKFKVNWKLIKQMFKFSSGNYVATFFAIAPGMILPIMITNLISPVQTAYFYVAWMIASLLFVVPTAVSQSLLTESSHEEIGDKVKKASKIIFLLLGIGVLGVGLLGKFVLLLFGKNYVSGAYWPLLVLALSSFPFAVNVIFITLENIKHNIKKVVLLYGLIAGITFVFSYLLLGQGLVGVSLGWLIGNLVVVVGSIKKWIKK